MKKIILILVDSLIPSVLEKCFQARTVPALQYLRDRGQFRPDCVTVFPTMTASVDSSLTTGTYPNVHKVPGLIWYDPKQKEMINYINGAKCVYKLGIRNCAQNVLFHLNEKHLSPHVTTIFEELAERGITSGSINMIIHRAPLKHQLRLPTPLQWLLRMSPDRTVPGPEILTLGAMAYPSILKRKLKKYFTFRYGINDDYAISAATELVKTGKQPDFTMIYLPNNDHEVHIKSPNYGESPLVRADQHIQRLLRAYGSWEQALKQNVIIVTSDHGQTHIGKEEAYNIDLDKCLQHYRVLQLGEKINESHQVVVCNNERMAYFYPIQAGVEARLIEDLKKESRIDLIAWKDNGQVRVVEGGAERSMTFSPEGPYHDPYGRNWSLNGDLTVLDIHVHEKHIEYEDYPDALSRLYGALFSQDCSMIVITARPKYEFKSKYHPMHNDGGSHGSLHKWDSLIPLFVAGAERDIPLPSRLVDLKNYILQLYDETPNMHD